MESDDAIGLDLEKYAERVDDFIIEILQPRRPEVLYEASRYIISGGGKRLRPYLVAKSCEIVGGDAELVAPFAAALELLHNFTLVHDDIMDNDSLRRGIPTVHRKYGLPLAIASGDLLFAKVYEVIIRWAERMGVSCEMVRDCVKHVTDATISICEGQVLDVSFPNVREVSEEDYFRMVGGKTAALFEACARVGAIVGGGEPMEIGRLGSYGWNAGVAFQLVDDYLGLTADERALGKPVGSDLREGKKTLIVIHALREARPAERDRLERILGNERVSSKEIKSALDLFDRTGSLRYALDQAKIYAERAKDDLKGFPASEAKRRLLGLVDYFMERRH